MEDISNNMEATKKLTEKKKGILVIAVLAAAIVLVFVLLILPRLNNSGVNLALDNEMWPLQLLEQSVPLEGRDFAMYSAYTYNPRGATITAVYSTQLDIDALREAYKGALDDAVETGENHSNSMMLSGKAGGNEVQVRNYYSDVANVISVDMQHSGEQAQELIQRVRDAFPQQALDAVPDIASFAKGETDSGYVMYSYDEYTNVSYPNIPIYSRSYIWDGDLASLTGSIRALGDIYTDSSTVLIGDGQASIKQGGYLYSVSGMERDGNVYAALSVQEMPE